MTDPIIQALRLIGHFWLEEVQPDDTVTIAALPELAPTLPNMGASTLTNLAVEYQRLFGFNLPPYESVFIDPSTMLMAPSTQRVQTLYGQGQWHPPSGTRAGAPDHLGLELLALADGLEAGNRDLVCRLYTRHLALWVPPFVLSLRRLAPHPFYVALGDLTLDLILTTLPNDSHPASSDPFPTLPPPPIYKSSDQPLDFEPGSDAAGIGVEEQDKNYYLPLSQNSSDTFSLRDLVKRLLVPRQAGLFLAREDMARIGQTLNAPGVMGERQRMLASLFRFAGQYDLVSILFDHLIQVLVEANLAYRHLADEYPAWTRYAEAWCDRVANTQTVLAELKQNM
jgi:TorA maturation chaperone TorD